MMRSEWLLVTAMWVLLTPTRSAPKWSALDEQLATLRHEGNDAGKKKKNKKHFLTTIF